MSDLYEKPFQQELGQSWLGIRSDLLAPLRALSRFIHVVGWILFCYAALRVTMLTGILAPRFARENGKRIARAWLERMPVVLGMKVTRIGTPPASPFFLICNHITWTDFIAMNSQFDSRCVVMAELVAIPFVGYLIRALNPIPVKRVKMDTARVLSEMIQSIRDGYSIHMAPEGVISPGRDVRRFHAGLLDSAVQTGMPVHYASLTYRTPEGSPPPSEAVIYGPDQYVLGPDGKILQSEIDLWGGPPKPFLFHLYGLLRLPYFEIVIRFARSPIRGTNRIALANDLHVAVKKIFTPVE